MRNSLLTIVCLLSIVGTSDAQVTDQAIEPAAETAQAAKRTYSAVESRLFYKLSVEADFGGERKSATSATVVYRIQTTQKNQLEVRCEAIWKSISNGDQGFYRLGSQRMSSSLPTRISSVGEPLEVRNPQWLMGLPVDVGRFAFPQLSDETQWELSEPVTLISSDGYGNLVQLLPVAPHIKRPSSGFRQSSTKNDTSDAVTIARTISKVVDQTEELVRIDEAFELDGTSFSPQVSVIGTGRIEYSVARQSVDSIQRSYIVTWKEPNRQMIVPISMKLERLEKEAILAYEESVRAKEERSKELRARAEAMRKSVPELSDRAAVMAVVTKGEREVFDALMSKLDLEKVSDDPALAKAIYLQLLSRDRVGYSTKAVINRLDPSLEKTVALADKYSKYYSSFDISLTGDEITPEAKLTKRQIICYRERSDSFQPALFYGAVEDVLVLETQDSPPKLIAVKRDRCRFPSADFLDPAIMAKDAPEAEAVDE